MRNIRRRRVLRDKKPRKAWVSQICKNRSTYGDFSNVIPRTSCRPRVITLCLLYFKNTNFRTYERMRRRHPLKFLIAMR